MFIMFIRYYHKQQKTITRRFSRDSQVDQQVACKQPIYFQRDVFRPSFLCSFKHALLQSLVFVVTGFNFLSGVVEEKGWGGGGLFPLMAYTSRGGSSRKWQLFKDSGNYIKRLLHRLEPASAEFSFSSWFTAVLHTVSFSPYFSFIFGLFCR